MASPISEHDSSDNKSKGVIKEAKWLAKLLLDCFFLLLLITLTLNSLIANWSWNLFLVRVEGPIFYNTHALSILCICAIGFSQIIQSKKITQSVVAVFGIASIHEIALDIFDFVVTGTDSGISFTYAAWLMAFLLIGTLICQKWQKKVWFFTLVLLLVEYSITYTIGIRGTTQIYNSFAPSENFYNMADNAAEVISWIIPASLWLLPQSLWERPLRLSSRR